MSSKHDFFLLSEKEIPICNFAYHSDHTWLNFKQNFDVGNLVMQSKYEEVQRVSLYQYLHYFIVLPCAMMLMRIVWHIFQLKHS